MCRCPYYRTAQHGLLYGTLNKTADWDTMFWSNLYNTTLSNSQCNVALPSLPQKFEAAFFANTSNPLCGEYLQLTSLYPGKGPCFPVLLETVDYFNRQDTQSADCVSKKCSAEPNVLPFCRTVIRGCSHLYAADKSLGRLPWADSVEHFECK